MLVISVMIDNSFKFPLEYFHGKKIKKDIVENTLPVARFITHFCYAKSTLQFNNANNPNILVR